jgi:hypothetical protein
MRLGVFGLCCFVVGASAVEALYAPSLGARVRSATLSVVNAVLAVLLGLALSGAL